MSRCTYCNSYIGEGDEVEVLGFVACEDCLNNFSRPEDDQNYDYQAIADAQPEPEPTP